MSDWPWDITCSIGTTPGLQPSGWEDVTGRLRREIIVSYGRQTEFDLSAIGEAYLTLDNRDGHWGPGIAPHTAVKLTVTVGATVYPLWYGLIQAAPAVWTDRSDATVRVAAVDGLSWLARRDVTLDFVRELTGTRVTTLLDAAGWPATLRDIDPGVVMLHASAVEDVPSRNVLTELEQAVESELGQLWIGPDGSVQFRDRHSRLDQAPAATFGSTHPMYDLVPAYDDLLLFTAGHAEDSDGDAVDYVDTAAVAAYGRRVYDIADRTITLVEAEAALMWVVGRYSEPSVHFPSLEVEGRVGDDLLTLMLTLQPGNVIRAQHTPDVGNAIDRHAHIERVEHVIGRGTWRTAWQLSPYFGEGPWLKWNNPTTGFWSAGNKWAP